MNIKNRLRKEAQYILPNDETNRRIKENLNISTSNNEKDCSSRIKESNHSKGWKAFGFSFAAVCVCLAIVLTVVYLPFRTDEPEISNSFVCLDINPSFAIETDVNDKVLNVTARNKDAAIVLFGMRYKGKSLNDVCNMIVESSAKLGYLNNGNNINILTVNDNQTKEETLNESIKESLNVFISNNNINTSIVDVRDTVEAKDAKKQNTTIGKLALANRAIGYELSDALDLELKELNNILDNVSKDEVAHINEKLEKRYDALENGLEEELDNLEELIDKLDEYLEQIEDIVESAEDKEFSEAVNYYNTEISKLTYPSEDMKAVPFNGDNSDAFYDFIKSEYERLVEIFEEKEQAFEILEDEYEEQLDNIKDQIKKEDKEDDDDNDDNDDLEDDEYDDDELDENDD